MTIKVSANAIGNVKPFPPSNNISSGPVKLRPVPNKPRSAQPTIKPVADFFNGNKDTIFRMQVYKRLYTPYEIEKKFMDETQFEDEWMQVCICSVYELPDKDILLGVRRIYEEDDWYLQENEWIIDYYKLSEIRLSYYPDDMGFVFEEIRQAEEGDNDE